MKTIEKRVPLLSCSGSRLNYEAAGETDGARRNPGAEPGRPVAEASPAPECRRRNADARSEGESKTTRLCPSVLLLSTAWSPHPELPPKAGKQLFWNNLTKCWRPSTTSMQLASTSQNQAEVTTFGMLLKNRVLPHQPREGITPRTRTLLHRCFLPSLPGAGTHWKSQASNWHRWCSPNQTTCPHPATTARGCIQDMLMNGIVERSTSPWASPIVLVQNKDGSTHKDAYPLPGIDTILDVLAGSKWFSTLDLLSG